MLSGPGSPPLFLAEGAGLLFGLADGTSYDTRRQLLGPDEALLIYSDGLVEEGKRPVGEGLDALAEQYASHS